MQIDPVILLVDDSPEDALLLQRAFQKAWIPSPLHVVTSAEQAMSYLAGTGDYSDRAAHPLPHLLLLDLKMRGLDGFHLLRWIRRTPALESLRVLILTSSSSPSDMAKAYRLGANSFLVKPDDFPGLVKLATGLHRFWLSDPPLALARYSPTVLPATAHLPSG